MEQGQSEPLHGDKATVPAQKSVDLKSLLKGSTEDFYFHWLELQCSLESEIVQGVLVLWDEQKRSYIPVSRWPLQSDPAVLLEIAEQVLAEECPLFAPLDSIPGHSAVGYPVVVGDQLQGVVAIELQTTERQLINGVMQILQWSVGWIELLQNKSALQSSRNRISELESSMRLLAVVQSESAFEAAAIGFVTELATSMSCARVSIGFPKGAVVELKAVSHSSQFTHRMNLIRAISEAMEEAIILGSPIVFPPGKEDVRSASHETLAGSFGSSRILTVPIYGNAQYYCAVTLERDDDSDFLPAEIEYCRAVSTLVAPSLEEKRLNSRMLALKINDAFMDQVKRMTGPHYPGRKLFASIALALVVFFTFADGTYRVSANASLEGEFQRTIASPLNGYIDNVPVRAGDRVAEGDLLCQLDNTDLRLERLGYLAERSQYQNEFQGAFASQDRAQLNIAKAQIDQVEARLQLVEEKLARTEVSAPFDGLLVSGDLSQRIGSYVEQGEELFVLVPEDNYRLMLNVDEKDIGDVSPGQKGELILTALPSVTIMFEVVRVEPESQPAEGYNSFRVEARLGEGVVNLQPGLEGIGKITIDERNLLSIWTRGLRNWFTLLVWKWRP